MKITTAPLTKGRNVLIQSLLLVALIYAVSSLKAVEVAPSDPTDQTPVSAPFKPIGNNNQLAQNNLTKKPLDATKNKKGVLEWFTSISRKPANFHYIDFIELFHKQ